MSTQTILSRIWEETKNQTFYNRLVSGESIDLKGLPGSLKAMFLHTLSEHLNRPLLVVLPTREGAEMIFEELAAFGGEEEIIYFPGGEEDPESPLILNPRRAGLQMRTVRDLLEGRLRIVVTASDGIAQRMPSPGWIDNGRIVLSENSPYDLFELVEQLIRFGYTREYVVEKPGEISLRGGILDVFPFTSEEPHRIEFFGNRVESMRTFRVDTQVSERKSDSLRLVSSPLAWADRPASLFSYFPSDLFIFQEDPELMFAEVEKELCRKKRDVFSSEELKNFFQEYQTLSFRTFSSPEGSFDFGGKPIRRTGNTMAEIRENIASLCNSLKEVFLFCGRENQKERVKESLDLTDDPISGLRVEVGPIHLGFHLPRAGLALYTEADLFGRKTRGPRRERYRLGVPIRELSSLRKKDFVVHIDYGIGEYQGLEKISVKGVTRECLSIFYQDGDKLYVPVDKMGRVQKYSGRQGAQPILSKLGSGRWERLKARTKRSIQNIAQDLIALYSARQAQPGHSYSKDTAWQRELEAIFPYEETPDQFTAVEDVKRDMERDRPMDRLICGDVGYGKTEVSVRAAFKAVVDGKQVALLVPTTILAQQHFRTFRERLSRFPVHVEVLSRFRQPKEQKEVVEKLKRGEVDIVIGTHRLLSKDVGFKDLGLLIIDEEQRFGVRHKERLKAFRKTVDVLTLTATPIPRTLHFSMMGIRDMSLINTPPKDRLPIITEVVPFDEQVIREAIEHEIDRGGQVFFVHNRIRSIYAVARMIRRLVPNIRLAVAHGRMGEQILEETMLEFDEGGFDCLVATMIIESGLDMPNVNTLIVHRADQLGLAQLYQLRGRVGRSERQAYAYLLTPPFHLLTDDAVKRLRTVEEFTELGSGFQIALRDLEIRGAGNVFGIEQSGNMDAVGVDLYMKLIDEAVSELREEEGHATIPDKTECRVDIDLDAYFPEFYVEEESLRVDLYRRLSSAQSDAATDAFHEELRDRFGPLPEEAQRLLDVAMIRTYGQNIGFKRISIKDKSLHFFFSEDWESRFSSSELLSERLRTMIDSCPVPVRFLQDKEFGIRLTTPERTTLSFVKKVLQSWS